MKYEKFNDEEIKANIDSLNELLSSVEGMHKSEPIPFYVSDVKWMCGLIYSLAIKAGYVQEEQQ